MKSLAKALTGSSLVMLTAAGGFAQGADECANADVLPAGSTTAVFDSSVCSDTGVLATTSAENACTSSADVWFLWTAATTGNATFDTCLSSSDTEIGVYEGTDCATMVNLACNDDSCSFQSSVTVPVTAGNTYYVQIGDWSATAGNAVNGTLTVTEIAPPPPPSPLPYGTSCLTTLFAANNGGATGGAVFFDLNTTQSISINSLEMNTTVNGAPVGVEMYITDTTYVGVEQDPTAWQLVGTGSGTGAGQNSPSILDLAAPVCLAAGDYGVCLVGVDLDHDYTNGGGANQSYTDGVVSLSLGGGQNTPFSSTVFSPRVWNGTICYTVDSSACLSTIFAANNGGAAGGAVYFDVTAAAGLTITGIESNVGSPNVGDPFGIELYTVAGGVAGNETTFANWTLAATGSGVTAGTDLPSIITLDNAVPVSGGTHGMAIVLVGTVGHLYTNGSGTNESYTDGTLTIDAFGGSNTPFTAPIFSPRVWNGTLCYAEGGILGASYCDSNVNSTGLMGDLSILGNNSLAANSINLAAKNLPAGETGYFVLSKSAGSIDLVALGLGDGILCLGTGKGRMVDTVQGTGASGQMNATLDLTNLPQSTPSMPGGSNFFAATAGQTLYFQGWFRDAGGVNGNNFTDGEAVLIQN